MSSTSSRLVALLMSPSVPAADGPGPSLTEKRAVSNKQELGKSWGGLGSVTSDLVFKSTSDRFTGKPKSQRLNVGNFKSIIKKKYKTHTKSDLQR